MNNELEVQHPFDSRQNTPESESRISFHGLSQEELEDLFGLDNYDD